MGTEEQILAEYSSVRKEIIQLNGQAFAIVTGSLALNFAILGAMFSSEKPLNELLILPLIALLVLAAGTILLAHKIRAAHRAALFQKHFIENRLPEIKWGRIYFKYRETYDRKYKNLLDRVSERFVDVQNLVLVVAQIIDSIILIKFQQTSVDTLFLILAVIVFLLQLLFLRKINDYAPMERVFFLILKEDGENSTEQNNSADS